MALFLALVLFVVLLNQTAQLVELASRLHKVAGDATLWGLIFLYVASLGAPVVLLLRLPPTKVLGDDRPADHDRGWRDRLDQKKASARGQQGF